jgi:hypothetical protein
MLGNLTLEEVIAAKLELSSRTLKSPVYGLPIWKHLPQIVQDAVLMFAISCTKTPTEAAMFLGMTPMKLYRLVKKYKVWNYMETNYNKGTSDGSEDKESSKE